MSLTKVPFVMLEPSNLASYLTYNNKEYVAPSKNYYGMIDYTGYNTTPGLFGTTPNVVSATITLPSGSALPMYCPTNNCMYVVNTLADNVSVVNCANNAIVATISTGSLSRPSGIAYCPSNNCMYVLDYGNSTSAEVPGKISVINCSTNTVTATIACGPGPQAVAYCPTNNYMYVVIYFAQPDWLTDNCHVEVIDSETNTIIVSIEVQKASSGICYVPTLDNLYVTNQTNGSISVISASTNTVTSTISLSAGSTPGAIQYCPASNCLYANDYANNRVNIYNLVSGAIANPAVGANPYDVQFCPTNNFIYVANQSPQTVSIIDSATAAVVKTLSLGVDGPSGSAWCPTNNCMYVACYGAGGTANGFLKVIQCGTHVTSDKLEMFGPITQAVATGQFFSSNGASTLNQYMNVANTSGSFLFGLEGVAADTLATGAAAYSTVLTTTGSTWLHFGVGSVVKLSINPSGNTVALGTISPQQATTAAAPAYVKGAIYFDTTLNKLRVGGATGWETITSV